MNPQTPDVQIIKTSIMIAIIKTDSESITVELIPRLEKLYSHVPTWLLQLLRDSILKIRIIITPLWMWRRLRRKTRSGVSA
jgi:hypothetical protein